MTRKAASGKPRWCGRKSGVSPVVGEVLMVSITIVLVGMLFYYLNTSQNKDSNIEPPMGARLDRTSSGNWTLSVVKGRTAAVDATLLVKAPNTGIATVSSSIISPSWYFQYSDNNANNYLDAGDAILLNQTAGVIEPNFKVEIVKSSGTLSGPLKLPS